jgi:holliday junction DNA helicase RuvA
MIALLKGRLVEKHPNRLIVDVGGVGYDVQMPLSTFYDLAEPGTEITLRIHTHVREDVIALYGFGTALELALFDRLLNVNGVGPKLALAILSGIEPRNLVTAIRTADIARLSSIPGIGRKTAERLSLELKDKLPAEAVLPSEQVAAPGSPDDALRTDALSALVALQYQRAAAEKGVERAMKRLDAPRTVERLIKLALAEMSR